MRKIIISFATNDGRACRNANAINAIVFTAILISDSHTIPNNSMCLMCLIIDNILWVLCVSITRLRKTPEVYLEVEFRDEQLHTTPKF